MAQSNEYKIKYEIAKKMYLEQEKSLTQIGKELGLDRAKLSNNLKKDGIEIINRQNITKFDETFFDIIDTEEKAYWLGFLYADGCVYKNNNNIELSLQTFDIKHLEKFRKSLCFDKNKHIFQDNKRCRIVFANKHMKNSLIKQGCYPNKSLFLTFPDEDILPNNLLFDFIRGYIDGDGSVMIGKNHRNEYTIPRLSILGTKEFLTELLNKTNWRICKIQHPSNIYSVEWSGKYVMEYLNQLYSKATIYLDRKYKKYLMLKELPSI